MKYLHWDQKTITDFSPSFINEMYEKGYVFTRLGKGVMQQTRSVRIDLSKFTPSSENRRILKKIERVKVAVNGLPLSLIAYDWKIGKMAKDFYETKFGRGIMSAQKIKEIMTEVDKSNFNMLISFSDNLNSGHAICYTNELILHYSYPFYDLQSVPRDMGLGMMIRAVEYAKNAKMKYVYLGSLQRPSDTYKLQFEGLEWFDENIHSWSENLVKVKEILNC